MISFLQACEARCHKEVPLVHWRSSVVDQVASHAACRLVENLDASFWREPNLPGSAGTCKQRSRKIPQTVEGGGQIGRYCRCGRRADVVRTATDLSTTEEGDFKCEWPAPP